MGDEMASSGGHRTVGAETSDQEEDPERYKLKEEDAEFAWNEETRFEDVMQEERNRLTTLFGTKSREKIQ